MAMLDNVTINQLRAFVAVCDQGSFSGAAREMRRAQSAISHAIKALESAFDVELFERNTRKATLTAPGCSLSSCERMESAERNRLFSTASYARILKPAKHNTCEQSCQSNACETSGFHATALSNPNIARVAWHFGKYDHLCEIAISDIHPR